MGEWPPAWSGFLPEERHEYQQLMANNRDIFYEYLWKAQPTTINLLEPANPLLEAMAQMPFNPCVRLHSVIGNWRKNWNGEWSNGVVSESSIARQGSPVNYLFPFGMRSCTNAMLRWPNSCGCCASTLCSAWLSAVDVPIRLTCSTPGRQWRGSASRPQAQPFTVTRKPERTFHAQLHLPLVHANFPGRFLVVAVFAMMLPALRVTADETGGRASAGIRAAIERFVDQGQIAGAVTVVGRHDQVLSHEAVGLRDIATRQMMTEDTLFRIASMTKPITAIGIMILADEGKLSVDDPVDRHLPEFRGQMLLVGGNGESGGLRKPGQFRHPSGSVDSYLRFAQRSAPGAGRTLRET